MKISSVGDGELHSSQPLVSIVIPVYNGADYLNDSISSALNQSYQNIEVIVINDGSCDEGATERIALSFGDAIRYYSKDNGGVSSALNLAVQKMSGKYLSWLSHDDLYTEDKIAEQIGFLNTLESENIILYSDYLLFTDNRLHEAVRISLPIIEPHHFRYWITSESTLHGCSLLVPREAFNVIGGFNETLRTTQDYELWFRMAELYHFVRIPKALVKARSHSNQGSYRIAGVAFQEASALYLKFVRALTNTDIPGGAGRDIGVKYLVLAGSLWQRGFHEAANHCATLSRSFGVSLPKVYCVRLGAYLVMVGRRYARQMFNAKTRQIVRIFVSRIFGFKRG